MTAKLTVAVLGPIPFDRVTTHRGDVLEKYGCALYTVAALSALLGPDDRICPVVHVRKQDEANIRELLSQFPQVDLTGIRSNLDRGDVVELDRLAGSPADLLVNGTLLARGEVVVVDESFGLRITEIVTRDAT